MNKAIFLDRDGTINVEKNYLYRIEDFEFLPGVVEGLKKLQDVGFKLVIITNQSGIARGYYTETDFRILNNWMVDELKKHDVEISAVYYCPHLPDATIDKYRKACNCRKPKLGLYEQAIKELNIDVENSYAIGDKIRDCSICEFTGCLGFLIGDNEEVAIRNRVKDGKYHNIKYVHSLTDAVHKIVEGN